MGRPSVAALFATAVAAVLLLALSAHALSDARQPPRSAVRNGVAAHDGGRGDAAPSGNAEVAHTHRPHDDPSDKPHHHHDPDHHPKHDHDHDHRHHGHNATDAPAAGHTLSADEIGLIVGVGVGALGMAGAFLLIESGRLVRWKHDIEAGQLARTADLVGVER